MTLKGFGPPSFSTPNQQPPRFVVGDPIAQAFAQVFADRLTTPVPKIDVREKFWGSLPRRPIYGREAISALFSYAGLLETEMASLIQAHCLPFWLHAYRRIPATTSSRNRGWAIHTRATLEAMFRKYAPATLCDGVAWSDEVLPERIMGGRFVKTVPENIVRSLSRTHMLTLTDFDVDTLQDVWKLERMAWDMHLCSIILRNVFWGAGVVPTDTPQGFREFCSPRFEEEAKQFDAKLGQFGASSTATVVEATDGQGDCLLAAHNFELAPSALFDRVLSDMAGRPTQSFRPPNFVWFRFPLDGFYSSHKGFEAAFQDRNSVSLIAVVRVLFAIYTHAIIMWRRNLYYASAHWNLCFDDSVTSGQIQTIVIQANRSGAFLKRFPIASDGELSNAIQFLTLTEEKRSSIDPLLEGPVFPFMPMADLNVVDYAWPLSLLERLFVGVNPSDQNFKGDALEVSVKAAAGNVLPTKKCNANDGTARQFDASFIQDDVLVIVECKAVARSLGFDRGDSAAQWYRLRKIRTATREVDEKARWLSLRPHGRNFRVPETTRWICPIVVSPFEEFLPLPSKEFRLTEDSYRVFTPKELGEAIAQKKFTPDCFHLVRIERT